MPTKSANGDGEGCPNGELAPDFPGSALHASGRAFAFRPGALSSPPATPAGLMRKLITIPFAAYWKFEAEDGWAISSHIALSILTSLFPFLIFLTSLAGFLGTQNLADEGARLIFDAWPPAVAGPIATEVHNVLTIQRSGLLTIGGLLALYFSSGAISALRIGLNRAYQATDTRPWWLLRLESIGFMLIAALALLALAFFVVLGPLIWSAALHFVPTLAPLESMFNLVRLGLASLLMGISLLVAHLWLPGGRRRLRDVAPGVALTFVCCLAFGEVFGAWLREFARNYVSTYAGLASVMIALVFLYSMAAIFIYGANLNAAILNVRKLP
jgi:membrane protein